MVPLQVWNSLQDPLQASRIRAIRHLIIGGGAVDANLAAALADFPNAVWSTYGMTETLSHIALRRLNGPERSDWYSPLEGVSVSVNADGCLVINAPAVHDGLLVTNDLAEIDGNRFRILGRKDNVICSGGIKIQIEEVEALLRPHLSMPFMITKIPDTRLGQQMVLLTEDADRRKIETVCRQVLPRYWQPRQVIYTEKLPLTETGKPARAAAEKLAEKLKN
jgi:O-succinylbenzoic acid--CoA ligase